MISGAWFSGNSESSLKYMAPLPFRERRVLAARCRRYTFPHHPRCPDITRKG